MPQLFAAAAALPGHADKLCDAVADALVEEATRRQTDAVCAVSVACHALFVDRNPLIAFVVAPELRAAPQRLLARIRRRSSRLAHAGTSGIGDLSEKSAQSAAPPVAHRLLPVRA